MSSKVLKIIKLIKRIYFDPTKIKKFEEKIMHNVNNHKYDKIENYEIANDIFDIVTKTINDKHITLSPHTKNHRTYNKIFFDKKRSEGKPYRVALIAVMRKMVHVVYSVWTNNMPFEEKN